MSLSDPNADAEDLLNCRSWILRLEQQRPFWIRRFPDGRCTILSPTAVICISAVSEPPAPELDRLMGVQTASAHACRPLIE
jgi:hypothetical protein